jgi:hypothetical protein
MSTGGGGAGTETPRAQVNSDGHAQVVGLHQLVIREPHELATACSLIRTFRDRNGSVKTPCTAPFLGWLVDLVGWFVWWFGWLVSWLVGLLVLLLVSSFANVCRLFAKLHAHISSTCKSSRRHDYVCGNVAV